MKTLSFLAAGFLAASSIAVTAQAAVADPTESPTATPAPAATATEAPATVPSATNAVECGKVTLTFNNPTKYDHTFDYRVDNQQAKRGPISGEVIKEGPFAGEKFSSRYNPVKVVAGKSKTVAVPFLARSGNHRVSYWLQVGPEQKWFLAPVTVSVKTACKTATTAPTFKQPRCSDKDAHIVTTATPNVRYYYQTGLRKVALADGDNKVRAGSSGTVVAVATSSAAILSGKKRWSIKFDKAPSTYTCS
ncbi:hypothetical protein ITP53_07690 [Nonomuraea sp. K274]|uniref:Ig-like domain-containing protein n=1 Tax=Nonomuraea cypriaca TaxID=1187855 RepID=A0A931A920_9ACTN|nr:hypothetical protein [Nonomuraea cypriaca]MBF8185620.1 hypothetical protein [Nonomuraea cypriaca]